VAREKERIVLVSLLRSSPRILYFMGNSGLWRGQGRTQQQSSFSLSLFLSRKSRLLGRVPRVERTCVRPQIADQRPT